MPRRDTIGSSIPSMVTTKLPLPGFSLLISTRARSPIALAILLDRVLNAPHCLQASTVTTFFPVAAFLDTAAAFFVTSAAGAAALALVALAFLGGTFLVAFGFADAADAAVSSGFAAEALTSRVDRRAPTMLDETIGDVAFGDGWMEEFG